MANPIFGAAGTSIFEAMSRLAVERGAINLGQGFPEGFEPSELLEAAARALRETSQQYPPMMGLPVLRQAVAENARRFLGLDVDWEKEVLVTSGDRSSRRYVSGTSGYGRRGHPVRAGLRCVFNAYPARWRESGAGAVEATSLGTTA